MRLVDYPTIIKKAWAGFDPSLRINTIEDISAKVSTNHVFKVTFDDGESIIYTGQGGQGVDGWVSFR